MPEDIGHDEFCARFKARMIARIGERFDGGESVAEAADIAAAEERGYRRAIAAMKQKLEGM